MSQLWNSVLGIVENKVQDHVFDTWFRPTEQKSYEEGVLTVLVPNRFFQEWLNAPEYRALIESSLQEIAVDKPLVRFEVNSAPPDNSASPGRSQPARSIVSDNAWPNRLNPLYTFQNFVIGASNQFANAAAMAVSESPATAYNPLFLFGGVGLGKTHLMHAIGHHVLERTSAIKIMYVTSESFVNDLISSLQRDRMESFRNKYRSIDILLIDDIQFIGGKDRTQEEFFHTFNTLYETRKQIVISSDRFPKDIPGLEERLRSRFEWGLIADIQSPDLETKIAILNKKAEKLNMTLSSDVSYYIASKIKSNIRELEGCLLRLSALSDLTGYNIDIDMAKKGLAEMFHLEDKPPSIERIQKIVADHFGINTSDLKSKKRNKAIAIPRQIAMYLIREHTSRSLPEIGRAFGNKDHSTVLHSCRKIKSLLENGQREIEDAIKIISDKLNL